MVPDEGPKEMRGPVLYLLLEKLTAIVLLLVIGGLAWITAAAYQPEWAQWSGVEVQVAIIVALLTLALLLVSVVALLHTQEC